MTRENGQAVQSQLYVEADTACSVDTCCSVEHNFAVGPALSNVTSCDN